MVVVEGIDEVVVAGGVVVVDDIVVVVIVGPVVVVVAPGAVVVTGAVVVVLDPPLHVGSQLSIGKPMKETHLKPLIEVEHCPTGVPSKQVFVPPPGRVGMVIPGMVGKLPVSVG